MSLTRSRQLPKDAVKMNEMEATTYIWDLVSEWDNKYETWALNYSAPILGGISAFAGIVINQYYRRKLRLGTYGQFASMLPIVVLPGALTTLFHRQLVSTDMLLMKNQSCPICYEVRSASIQLGFGVVYPMVLGPLSALMFANRYCTYRLPSITEKPKEMFHFLRKLTKPFSATLTALTIGGFVMASILTYFQLKNTYAIRRKIFEAEKLIDQDMANLH